MRFFAHLALLMLLVFAAPLGAQWKLTAYKKIVPSGLEPPRFGAIRYAGGTLWAGWRDLWSSSDLGISWKRSNANLNGDLITDIAFFDAKTGIYSTAADGVFFTNDGGGSWKRILQNISGIFNIAFGSSAGEMYAISGNGIFYSTKNSGGKWNQTRPGADFGTCFTIARDGTIYASTTAPNLSGEIATISKSTDKGTTWTITSGTPDGDSNTMLADSCDANRLYLVSENHESSVDPNNYSEIFFSSDAGNNWTSTLHFPTFYFSGGGASAEHAIYATALDSNIWRSTDQGLTWKDIALPRLLGAPNPNPGLPNFPDTAVRFAYDARNITCASDNIVFVMDTDGSIWRTLNSGGDSVISIPDDIIPAKDTLFATDSLVICDTSLTRFLSLNRSGCLFPAVTNIALAGASAPSYTIIPLAGDSVGVIFVPKAGGPAPAQLIITLSNGTQKTVTLAGYGIDVPNDLAPAKNSLFEKDSLLICDSSLTRFLRLAPSGCSPPTVTKIEIIGADALSYDTLSFAGDSIGIKFLPLFIGTNPAQLVLTLTDGNTKIVTLSGYGMPRLPLQIISQNLTLDTLGGSAYVPITIKGLPRPSDITLIIHYDTVLQYDGTFSPDGSKQYDQPAESWKGRAKIEIPNASSNGIAAYARFDVFNDSLPEQHVLFDSLTVLSPIPQCIYMTYNFPEGEVSLISPLSGCGITLISRFLHWGEVPQFAIYPNPTGGEAYIVSSSNSGEGMISIYNMLGEEKGSASIMLEKNIPAKIVLPHENGIYDVRIQTSLGTSDQRVVVTR